MSAVGRRRVRRAGVAALLAGLGGATAAVICFAVPHEDPLPARADVAIVLGPPEPPRVRLAMSLLERGVVDHVLISVSADAARPNTWSHAAMQRCEQDERVLCQRADAHTTQGEARMLARDAQREGWHSAVAVTQTAHLLRAKSILGRCFHDPIAMRASGEAPDDGWPHEIAYQTAASVKAWLHPGC